MSFHQKQFHSYLSHCDQHRAGSQTKIKDHNLIVSHVFSELRRLPHYAKCCPSVHTTSSDTCTGSTRGTIPRQVLTLRSSCIASIVVRSCPLKSHDFDFGRNL